MTVEPEHGGPIVDFLMERFLDILNLPKACKCDDFGGCVHRVDGEDSYRCTECNEIIKNAIGCHVCSRYGKAWMLRGYKVPDTRPRCARCKSLFYKLDAESVCGQCRKDEVNRDDGC